MFKLLQLALILLCALVGISTPAYASTTPTNIILIFSDDVGAETIGVYGGESYNTPELNQLANDGVRFDYGHAQPLCTPSRVKIMTGQYNFRNYSHFDYLDPGETTFAHLLKAAGYRTMLSGKWQLYSNHFEDITGSLPNDAGFDQFMAWHMTPESKGSRYWGPSFNTDGELRKYEDSIYGPDLLNDYVLNYIDEHVEHHADKPFFIYYPMVLAHDPWVTTPDMLDESASKQEKFAAMMAYMDKLVGKVRDKVEQSGLSDNTVIFYIGDNGTGREIVSSQHGVDVAGAKALTIDAGTRVPFMAWGAGVAPGTVSNSLVNLNDVLPTLVELAGTALPPDYPGDGQSLLPVMSGNRELDRDSLFIHYEPRWPSGRSERYAFDRQYKLYEGGGFYDMLADPVESSALDLDQLSKNARARYELLSERIARMPGELSGPRRWIPSKFYYYIAAALFALGLVIWLIWRLLKLLRR